MTDKEEEGLLRREMEEEARLERKARLMETLSEHGEHWTYVPVSPTSRLIRDKPPLPPRPLLKRVLHRIRWHFSRRYRRRYTIQHADYLNSNVDYGDKTPKINFLG